MPRDARRRHQKEARIDDDDDVGFWILVDILQDLAI
jgi:hypothetical protein